MNKSHICNGSAPIVVSYNGCRIATKFPYFFFLIYNKSPCIYGNKWAVFLTPTIHSMRMAQKRIEILRRKAYLWIRNMIIFSNNWSNETIKKVGSGSQPRYSSTAHRNPIYCWGGHSYTHACKHSHTNPPAKHSLTLTQPHIHGIPNSRMNE